MSLDTKVLRQTWKQDLKAGFIVFLIALPLCVGISIASGAPSTAGIITAIVGGILGSVISGSFVTINGPAAGLIAVVLACIEELGNGVALDGYRALLACAVVAGAIQIVIGWCKGGRVGLAFPITVVHGMLSAIGLIIIAKQLHVILGVSPQAKSPFALFAELPHSVMNLNPEIAAIGLVSLAVMFFLGTARGKRFRVIPAPLLAVLIGTGMGLFFDLNHEHTAMAFHHLFTVGPKFLLSVPDHLADAVFFPNFSVLGSPLAWKHVFMITFVASIESILSACAVDQFDPEHRTSNLDKEMVGKGFANIVASSVGGLPMIAEIVRSSANVANGAKTQWSNFFHGAFLLLFLLLVPKYLHFVPLASLAGLLVFVGYGLANPRSFVHAFDKGREQGIVFTVTTIAILATDLLIGVVIGTIVAFLFNAYHSRTFRLFGLDIEVTEHPEDTVLSVRSPVAFTNYLRFRGVMENLKSPKNVTIDLSAAQMIDQTVMEHLSRHANDRSKNGVSMKLVFSDFHYSHSTHAHAAKSIREKHARHD